MLRQRLLRRPCALTVRNQAVIADAARRPVHGASLLARTGILVVGPKGAADKRDAVDDNAIALEQMDVRVPGRLQASVGQFSMAIVPVELVIACHVDHRLGIQLLADDETHAFGQALADVACNDHDVMGGMRRRQLERKAPVHVDVQIRQDPELHEMFAAGGLLGGASCSAGKFGALIRNPVHCRCPSSSNARRTGCGCLSAP